MLQFAPFYAACRLQSKAFCRNWLCQTASTQSRLDRLSMSFFGLTPLKKTIFYKFHRLRLKDAVFTVALEIYGRMFLVSDMMSLRRTVSAQFNLKVRFSLFFTDPPFKDGLRHKFASCWKLFGVYRCTQRTWAHNVL